MFNRFFGRKQEPEEEPKQETGAVAEPVLEQRTEQRFGFLQRTRQMFSRINTTVEQSDTITDSLWDDLE